MVVGVVTDPVLFTLTSGEWRGELLAGDDSLSTFISMGFEFVPKTILLLVNNLITD